MARSSTAARLRALRAHAAAAALVDVGRRLGLFARLAGLPAQTREELAQVACVDPSWLGDWLDGLVLGGLVDHDGARRTYAIDAALALDDDVEGALFDAARALHAGAGAVLVDVGADAPALIGQARRRLAEGERLVVAIVDAAPCVSDNLDHPLGAALYARSLARRADGRGGVLDEAALVRAFEAAGMKRLRAQRRGGVLVVDGEA